MFSFKMQLKIIEIKMKKENMAEITQVAPSKCIRNVSPHQLGLFQTISKSKRNGLFDFVFFFRVCQWTTATFDSNIAVSTGLFRSVFFCCSFFFSFMIRRWQIHKNREIFVYTALFSAYIVFVIFFLSWKNLVGPFIEEKNNWMV